MNGELIDQRPSPTSKLNVDRFHPVFFDHSLDHVPGMLLMSEAIRRVEQEQRSSQHRMVTRFTFSHFGELDSEIDLRITPGASTDTWATEVLQQDTVICTGHLSSLSTQTWTSVQDGHREESNGIPQPSRIPVDGHLVHRSRAENIMLGQPERDDTQVRVAMLDPAPGHYFRDRTDEPRSVAEVIEAARQFASLLWPYEFNASAQEQLVLDAADCDLPRSLPRDVAVELRWQRQRKQSSRSRFPFEVWISGDTDKPVGTAGISCRSISPSAYRRLRARYG